MRGDIAWAEAKLAGLCRRRGAGPGLAEQVGRGHVTIGLEGRHLAGFPAARMDSELDK